MERTAEDRAAFLRQLLAASRDAFIVVGTDGELVLANDAARGLLGLPDSVNELPVPACSFLSRDGLRVTASELPWNRAVAGESVADARLVLRWPSGGATPIEVTAAPLREADGTIIGAAASLSVCEMDAVETLREELARSELLEHVALAATSAGDLHSVALRVLKVLARRAGLLAGEVRVLSLDGITLTPSAAYRRDDRTEARVLAMLGTRGQSLERMACSRKVVMTHQDVGLAEDPRAGADEGIRYAVVPVEYRKAVIGTLSLAFEGRRPFGDDEVDVYRDIARVLGQVAAQSRRLEAQKETTRRAEGDLEVSAMLLEAAERLARPLEVGEVLDALADSMVRVTGRRRVFVVMHDSRTNEFVVKAVRGAPATMLDKVGPLGSLTEPVRKMLESGPHQPLVEDVPASAEQIGRMKQEGVERALVLPISQHGRVLGAALVDDPGSAEEFSVREVQLCENVAHLAAAVIENARTYEAEHRIAETLQETLLLMPEHVDGVVFGTLYRSATASARVGGDFYDLFEVGDDRVALVVGDVSGKGLDAASVTALARNAVRIHASEGLPPGVVMEKTNDVLHRFTSTETFVTAFFGVLELATGALTYVSAGHPEGMIVGKGGYVRRLGGDSPLLGALEDVTFAERVTLLAPTDTVFLYTDGVTEARCDGEMYGTERLADLLGSLRHNDPMAMPAVVLAAVEAFSQGRLRDDIAMLAVRRDGAADP